jgi:hypothetical protein
MSKNASNCQYGTQIMMGKDYLPKLQTIWQKNTFGMILASIEGEH